MNRLASQLRQSLKTWIFRARRRWLKRPQDRRMGRKPGRLRCAIQLEFRWNSKV